ncbi:MAG: ATP-binding cassette domain-containing protein, partial [Syntrophomonas sp.]|nr:ATP-binding cassette domain-containing protein [Syntrophomonas sp.]
MNSQDSDFVLQVNNLSAGYKKEEKVIENISFAVGKGEMVGLLGKNGAGKSTLIKAIHGLIHKTQGEVELPGSDYA